MHMRLIAMASACAALMAVCGSASAAPLADRHVGRGLPCDKCHVPAPPAVKFENCLACHGGADKLIARKPVHAMLKQGAQCGMCHKGHKE